MMSYVRMNLSISAVGAVLRFHRDRCWADVTIDDKGAVTAFEPYDAAICQQLLANCR
jgi:hypothetical protein